MSKELERVRKFVKRSHNNLYERLAYNRENFSQAVCVSDFHSHTVHSDGSGEVAEMSSWAEEAGLDLLAITDHLSVSQAAECESLPNLWCGQEYKCDKFGHHYLALGHNHEVISKEDDPFDNLNKVQENDGLVIVPHPTGWLGNPYPEEKYADLEFFAEFGFIEIGNGAGNLINYWDRTDRTAVQLWERLLESGKRIIGFGNSDAHIPLAAGIIFNGLLWQPKSVAELRSGKHFVSNGPFLKMKINGVEMGSSVVVKDGNVEIDIEAVDLEGLVSLRLIKNGKQIWSSDSEGSSKIRTTVTNSVMPETCNYYRVECYAVDGHRAFTNPIWVDCIEE